MDMRKGPPHSPIPLFSTAFWSIDFLRVRCHAAIMMGFADSSLWPFTLTNITNGLLSNLLYMPLHLRAKYPHSSAETSLHTIRIRLGSRVAGGRACAPQRQGAEFEEAQEYANSSNPPPYALAKNVVGRSRAS